MVSDDSATRCVKVLKFPSIGVLEGTSACRHLEALAITAAYGLDSKEKVTLSGYESLRPLARIGYHHSILLYKPNSLLNTIKMWQS